MSEHVGAFLSKWTAAEGAGDVEALGVLLTDDFYGVGPLGFVLPRHAWLARHHEGLAYEHFGLEEIHIHLHDGVAVVTARHDARGHYRDQPLPGSLRVTLVVASESEAPQLAAVHMSFIAGMPGSPPLAAPPPAEPAPEPRKADD